MAIDYSEDAISHLQENSENIEAMAADICSSNLLSGKSFDVVVLSHVLEHLENTDEFLKSVQRIDFSHIVIEVPLEDLPYGKVKDLVRDRMSNNAGHVRFFTARSLQASLGANGLNVIDDHRYMPLPGLDSFQFVTARDNLSKVRSIHNRLFGYYLPRFLGPIWKQFFYAHYAVWCQKEA